MVYLLLAYQVLLPLALLAACMFVARRGSRTLWLLAVATTGLVLQLLALIGIWIVPPWWMLWVYVALWLVAIGFGVRRWSSMSPMTRGVPAKIFALVLLLLASYCVNESLWAWRGREAPATRAQPLEFPLRDGEYLVLNGGSDIRLNAHLKTRDLSVPRFARWRGNGYAVDIVAIDRWGLRARGLLPKDNRNYRSFGRAVFAPCSGKVIVAVDGLPDMTPPQYDSPDHLAGNHIILECGGLHVVLAHFRRGSIRVRVNERVIAGQLLAEVGNSGGTDEAHLHIHVQRPGTPDAPMSGEPIPALFDGRFLVRGDRLKIPGG